MAPDHMNSIDQLVNTIDPNDYVSEARQQELIDLADQGFGASAIRLAIREAIASVKVKTDERWPAARRPGIYILARRNSGGERGTAHSAPAGSFCGDKIPLGFWLLPHCG
jgi:hypothetical protein